MNGPGEALRTVFPSTAPDPVSQPFEFALRPLRLKGEATGLSPVDDGAPGLGGGLEPALALQEEGGAVQRTDVVGVELEREPPVGERAIRIAHPGLHLSPT